MNALHLAGLTLALLVSACSSRVVLLPGEDGAPTGMVAVLSRSGATKTVLDQAYSDTKVTLLSAETTQSSEEAVDAELGALLTSLPKPPSHFTLYFIEGTTRLIRSSKPELKKIFAEIEARPGADIHVIGHTDTVGSLLYNDKLSVARADEISASLVTRGINSAITKSAGRGERELLIPTRNNVRNQKNRRVEVLVR